eukprot:10998468-Karenia_brevis.AAC.1
MPLSVEGDDDGEAGLLIASQPAMCGNASGKSDVDSTEESWEQRVHDGQWQEYDQAAWDDSQNAENGNGEKASSSSDRWVAGSPASDQ